jgi:hypothetical protein
MVKDNLLSQMASDSGNAPDQIDNLRDKALDEISSLAQNAANLEQEIANDEEALQKKKEALREITDEQLPGALEEMNLQKFTLMDGSEISVKPIYGASIPKGRKEEAFKWLRDHNFGDLVKNNVSVTFARGEDEIAKNFVDLCADQGFVPSQIEKVEPMTLKGWLREEVEAGNPVPLDLFGAFIKERAFIKRIK